MVTAISTSSTSMTASASGGLCRPKNAGVHNALAASCHPQSRNGRAAPERRQTSQPATPIIT